MKKVITSTYFLISKAFLFSLFVSTTIYSEPAIKDISVPKTLFRLNVPDNFVFKPGFPATISINPETNTVSLHSENGNIEFVNKLGWQVTTQENDPSLYDRSPSNFSDDNLQKGDTSQ